MQRRRRLYWNCWHKNWEQGRKMLACGGVLLYLCWGEGLFMDLLESGACQSQTGSFPLNFSPILSPCGPQMLTPPCQMLQKPVSLSHRWKRWISSWSSTPRERSNSSSTIFPLLGVWESYRYSGQTSSSFFIIWLSKPMITKQVKILVSVWLLKVLGLSISCLKNKQTYKQKTCFFCCFILT